MDNALLVELAQQHRRHPSPSEAILWAELRGRKLEGRKFRQQHPIEPYLVDFCCLSERLVIEIETDFSNQMPEFTEQRQKAIKDLGYQVLQFSPEDIEKNLPAVIETIKAAFVIGSGTGKDYRQ